MQTSERSTRIYLEQHDGVPEIKSLRSQTNTEDVGL